MSARDINLDQLGGGRCRFIYSSEDNPDRNGHYMVTSLCGPNVICHRLTDQHYLLIAAFWPHGGRWGGSRITRVEYELNCDRENPKWKSAKQWVGIDDGTWSC